jgi:MFS family permease
MSLIGAQTSLWWMRVLMFCLGIAMGQVFVPSQAAAFATISPQATGRASTMFSVARQLGSATGVAVLTTAVVTVGATTSRAGQTVPNLTAYHVAFLVAAGMAVAAAIVALTIHDADAATTIAVRGGRGLRAQAGPPSVSRRRPKTKYESDPTPAELTSTATATHIHFEPRIWLAGRLLRSMSTAVLRPASATAAAMSSLRLRSLSSLHRLAMTPPRASATPDGLNLTRKRHNGLHRHRARSRFCAWHEQSSPLEFRNDPLRLSSGRGSTAPSSASASGR